MAKAVARADVDPVLSDQINALKTQAKAESTAALQGNQTQWMIPDPDSQGAQKWEGDLFDTQSLQNPFDRSQSNSWFADAIKDPSNPGTVGDQAVTTAQVDYLASMERAFRMRHARWPRMMIHAMGRKAGHGNDKGPLVQCVLESIRGMVKKSKGNGP
jgi:hypothetical protein